MVKFGIIGTNAISHTFMAAALKHPEFVLKAVYSRTADTGNTFAETYQAKRVYTELEAMALDEEIDAVYIASPNSCHAKQAILLLEHGKHVLCEKPIAADSAQLSAMLEAAGANHVVLLEAMRSAFDPGFAKIQELLPQLGTIRQAAFQYCKYSSRYDKFKAGEIMNAFNPKLSNAAVMDIGVYCVHPMVKLFGMPKSVKASSVFLSNNMEGLGTVIAQYDGMQAVLQYSKITNTHLSSQIQGEEAAMIISEIQNTRRIELHYNNGSSEICQIEKHSNNMYYEVDEFIRLINAGEDPWKHNQYSVMEMEVMDMVRRDAGIEFQSCADNSFPPDHYDQ